MSRDLLEKFIRQYFLLFPGPKWFIWHGGEPLMAGRQFFDWIVEFQERHNVNDEPVRNSVQTNATLVNDDWAEFFAENGFGVGVSIDGSPQHHDHHRKTARGGGSFENVERGIATLRSHGIEPGFIQTLTSDTIDNPAEDFGAFLKQGTRQWGVNSYLDLMDANPMMKGQTVTDAQLTKYMLAYIEAWLHSGDPDVVIREIESSLAGVIGEGSSGCSYNGSCTHFFCLEHDGEIYPCDRLTHRPDLLFGNLRTQSLGEILTSGVRATYVAKQTSLHPDCAACEYQPICHNGCTHHRVGGVDGKYYYCGTRKAVFGRLKEAVATLTDAKETE